MVESTSSRNWIRETLDRLSSDLLARAEGEFPKLTSEEAQNWALILAQALLEGVAASCVAFRGNVDLLSNHLLAPQKYDVSRMFRGIKRRTKRPEVQEFLNASIVSAVDPSEPFGNEIMSHIATAQILHAFIARRDQITARNTLGVRGARAILDTPILLMLLGPDPQASAMTRAIGHAVAAGMEVIVPNHCLDEVFSVISRLEREVLPQITEALAGGVRADLIGHAVDEGVVRSWVAAREQGRYEIWEDFRGAARRLRDHLTKLGVVCRDHGNQAADRVADFESELTRTIRARGAGRGTVQVERDANTMAIARRTRLKTRCRPNAWPSAWVITTDSFMNPAYEGVEANDDFPLALTPSRWISLISTCASPPQISELAKSYATLLAHETVLNVAATFPPQVAIELARALSREGMSPITNIRVAQLSLVELLDLNPDFLTDPAQAAASITGAVLAHRSRRLALAYNSRLRQVEADHERQQEESVRRARREDKEREARQHASAEEGRRREVADAVDSARRQERLLARRRIGVAATLGAVGVLVVVLFLQRLPAWGFGVATAGLLSLLIAREWMEDEHASWWGMVRSLIPQLLGIFKILRR